MIERYKVIDGSNSGHCCFVSTVVDTLRPLIIHGKPYHNDDGGPQFETVCECFEAEDAKKIAAALNECSVSDSQQNQP